MIINTLLTQIIRVESADVLCTVCQSEIKKKTQQLINII